MTTTFPIEDREKAVRYSAILSVDIVRFGTLEGTQQWPHQGHTSSTQVGVVEALEGEVSNFLRHMHWIEGGTPSFVGTGDGFILAMPRLARPVVTLSGLSLLDRVRPRSESPVRMRLGLEAITTTSASR
jgi:hypothetical protein